MSETSPVESSAPADKAGAASQPPKRRRSPIERAIVWTLIIALGAAVGWQWYCRDSYSRTLTALDAVYDTMRESIEKEKADFIRAAKEKGVVATPPEIYAYYREHATFRTASEIRQFIYGIPSVTVSQRETSEGPMRQETYTWRGPFQSYEIYVTYELGDDPRLVNVDSKQN